MTKREYNRLMAAAKRIMKHPTPKEKKDLINSSIPLKESKKKIADWEAENRRIAVELINRANPNCGMYLRKGMTIKEFLEGKESERI